MRQRLGKRRGPRHPVASFDQGPIETLSVKCNQDAPLAQPFRKREQNRSLLAMIAHEKLFHDERAVFPPGHADQERVRAAAARQARGLDVKKEPPVEFHSLFSSIGNQQTERANSRLADGRVAKLAANEQVLAKVVASAGAGDQPGEPLRMQRGPAGAGTNCGSSGAQRSQTLKFIV